MLCPAAWRRASLRSPTAAAMFAPETNLRWREGITAPADQRNLRRATILEEGYDTPAQARPVANRVGCFGRGEHVGDRRERCCRLLADFLGNHCQRRVARQDPTASQCKLERGQKHERRQFGIAPRRIEGAGSVRLWSRREQHRSGTDHGTERVIRPQQMAAARMAVSNVCRPMALRGLAATGLQLGP
jgi:hypothetical protein